jgi:poly-gamma-glutamate synthesis protein (capsule biosynthesis protein)
MNFIFLGDLCISGTNRPALSQSIDNLFKNANSVCINFEAPLIDNSIVVTPKIGPSISQTEFALQLVKDCCTTHVNLANNHIMDFGAAGLEMTLAKLQGISTIGAGLTYGDAYRASFVGVEGQNVALLAFGEAQFGVLQDQCVDMAGFAWIDSPDARRSILRAKEMAKWVIVQVHAGLEMVDIPLPEWRDRYRELIDLGADLVIGHHPHVLQGSECYKGKMIHYSLGNFYMDIMLQQVEPGSGGLLQVFIDDNELTSRIIPLQITLDLIDIDESSDARQAYHILCKKLSDEVAYYAEIKNICDFFWATIYSKYYNFALTGLGTNGSISNGVWLLRRILALKRRRSISRTNELMLIHNIRIETHRWVVSRALALRSLE